MITKKGSVNLKKLNKKGFTLPEVLISFLVISLIVTWVANVIPNLKVKSTEEYNRLVSVMRNIDIIETTRDSLNDPINPGELKEFEQYELAGDDEYGNGVFYASHFDKYESSTDLVLASDSGIPVLDYSKIGDPDEVANIKANTTIQRILINALKHPEMAEYRPVASSKAELYFIEVDTTVGQKTLKTSSIKTFLYRNAD